ncbi:hypothetical protein QR305_02960 [Bacteroides finegoldii]|jgi:hypothetical protein|uniref:Uncharacterized protein n=2 Tax=Bacteroides TaxID=816 RepID=K5DER4_9BACE|nr:MULTISPECIES: hypothetical protein [Bacteroidaceae]MCE8711505.1 hypothetical protein [Bacteroides fragilis]MCS2866021.1 hypothetical protein [Bacteroides thetaiotaomicron]EKJ91458.1 hypothetical protein HMPREF1057_01543 [Bacteroides finegoldii CL09T03C10]KAB5407911.1 hypothetical protein F9Z96_22540 [Phocaeicola vulgatus]KWR51621.1 hypothetical protein AA416_05193 [Bacteroides cellulosilyticus]
MDNKRKTKLINYLHNNNLLVHEIVPLKKGYRSWFVISQSEDPKYSFKIRKESFSIEDIENDYDVIGKHEFSDFVFLGNIDDVYIFLRNNGLVFEEFTESWNTDYPL